MAEPGRTAVGSWSGGRFMHFGEALDDARLAALLRPGEGIRTVMTADVYGAGEADTLVGRALAGLPRDDYVLVGSIGHDFYEGERSGPAGYPRFTDPALRGPDRYADYVRMAVERSLERCGVSAFELLLLHNPDRTGFEHPAVWDALLAVRDDGLAAALGVAPGPANGFTLDLIGCFERYGELIDWAMVILNPLEPWPGELALDAAAQHGVRVITRVVDCGGLFHDDVLPGHRFADRDHRTFRPAGWVEAGRERMKGMRPIAERHGLTMLQLACHWNLAHAAVECVVPTLIEEADHRKPIEAKRAELASLHAAPALTPAEVDEMGAIGDNKGCMTLKGASPEHSDERADRWPLGAAHRELASRWGIDPDRELRKKAESVA